MPLAPTCQAAQQPASPLKTEMAEALERARDFTETAHKHAVDAMGTIKDGESDAADGACAKTLEALNVVRRNVHNLMVCSLRMKAPQDDNPDVTKHQKCVAWARLSVVEALAVAKIAKEAANKSTAEQAALHASRCHGSTTVYCPCRVRIHTHMRTSHEYAHDWQYCTEQLSQANT